MSLFSISESRSLFFIFLLETFLFSISIFILLSLQMPDLQLFGTTTYSSIVLVGESQNTFTFPGAVKFTCEKGTDSLTASDFTAVTFDVKEVEGKFSQVINVEDVERMVCPGAPFVGATVTAAGSEQESDALLPFPAQGQGYTVKTFAKAASAESEGGVVISYKAATSAPTNVSFESDFFAVKLDFDGCKVTAVKSKEPVDDVLCIEGAAFTAVADTEYEVTFPNFVLTKRFVTDADAKVTYATLGGIAVVIDQELVMAQALDSSASYAGILAAGFIAVSSVAALLF